jgi:tetratricopeptide (TPR) repeat protein
VTFAIYRYLSSPNVIYRKRPFANYHRLSKIQGRQDDDSGDRAFWIPDLGAPGTDAVARVHATFFKSSDLLSRGVARGSLHAAILCSGAFESTIRFPWQWGADCMIRSCSNAAGKRNTRMNVFLERMKRLHNASATAALLFFLVSFMGSAVAIGAYDIPQANEFVRSQDWQGLLRYAQAWTRAEPNTPMAWFYLGATLDRQFKQPEQAAPALEKAVAMQHVWPQAWNALGFVYVELKRPGDSAKAFSKAAQQAPENPHYWGNLAAALSFQNKLSATLDALENQRRALGSSTSFVEWYNLGNGFIAMGDDENATKAYRRAIQLNPNYADVWNNLGALEASSGNTQAALNDYQRAAALGDPVGRNNYQRLQNAIAAANRPDPPIGALRQLEISQEHDRQFHAQREWQEHLGAPPQTGQY